MLFRSNVNAWVNTYRPAIKDKKTLDTVAKTIANSLFNATNTSDYQKALKTGSAADIIDEHLRTGFDNYKNLSKFEGILLMDLPTDTLQYFTDYDDMAGKIKHDSVYLYGPEGEVMPKVTLTTGMAAPGGKGTKGLATEPAKMGKGADLTKAAGALTGAPTPKAAPAKEPVVGVGRQKRK